MRFDLVVQRLANEHLSGVSKCYLSVVLPAARDAGKVEKFATELGASCLCLANSKNILQSRQE